jgi:hypothetical protein
MLTLSEDSRRRTRRMRRDKLGIRRRARRKIGMRRIRLWKMRTERIKGKCEVRV